MFKHNTFALEKENIRILKTIFEIKSFCNVAAANIDK